MARVEQILINVRDTLTDENKKRFTDERLLRLLDEGQKFLVQEADLLRKKTFLPKQVGVALYQVPEDCHLLQRVMIDGSVIPFRSHEQMDDLEAKGLVSGTNSWEDATGAEAEFIVYDKLNYDNFKVYPIPTLSSGETVLTASPTDPEDLMYDPVYGVFINTTGYTTSSLFGIVSDVSDDADNTIINVEDNVDPRYGFTLSIDEDPKDIILYYQKIPDTIYALDDELEVSSVWDKILKYYVAGMALKDDKDTQNRSYGAELLAIFGAGVQNARKGTMQNNLDVKTQYSMPYKTGFEF